MSDKLVRVKDELAHHYLTKISYVLNDPSQNSTYFHIYN